MHISYEKIGEGAIWGCLLVEQIWRKDKFNFNHVDWTFGVNKFDVDHIQN